MTRINHTGHGHPATPADRNDCRIFMATHNGMDEVTYRVSVREAELDDAFEDEAISAELAALVKTYRAAREAHKGWRRGTPTFKRTWKAMMDASRALRDAGLDPADWDN
jgi:hypothetical protein